MELCKTSQNGLPQTIKLVETVLRCIVTVSGQISMIPFVTLKKLVFLGRRALHKISNKFDTSSYVINSAVQMYCLDIDHISLG